MPNTKPPIVTKADVARRLLTAKEQGCLWNYYLYIGITSNSGQIREAVEVAKSHPRVVGIKMYAGSSTGDLAVVDEASQFTVYKELAEAGYDGVLAVHCEKESMFNLGLFDPDRPYTWNLARPVESEWESVKDQIKFAKMAGFEGRLYIAHASTPETVDIVQRARSDGMDVYCEVTPHHTTKSTEDMAGREGLMLKCNPPLRDYGRMSLLRRYTISGRVDTIGSDHAPHKPEEKMNPPSYASGITSLGTDSELTYSKFLDGLGRNGAAKELIRELTYENVKKIFEKVKV
jgi:dihydroorotase